MALPDVTNAYEIAVKAQYRNQLIVNRFHYLASAGTAPNYANLATDFDTDVWTPILTVLSNNFENSSFLFTPLFGTALGTEIGDSSNGGIASPLDLPPFLAWQFKLNHGDRRVRPGQKRFAGVTEQVVDGYSFSSAYSAQVATLLAGLAQVITDGTLTFTPIVIHYPTVKYPDIITPTISAATFSGWTTQNSRKQGSGQ